MNELIARWKLRSPSFFVGVANFGKWIMGVGAVLMAATVAAPESIKPELVETIKIVSSYMIFGGSVVLSIAKLTVADPEALKDLINNKPDEKL